MRRKDREVTSFDEIIKIVDECEIVRIGLADGDYPYIVPLNFGYEVVDSKLFLYIHGAMAGRKYEMLLKNPCCSFEMDIPLQMDCIIDKKDVTMRYKSVMGKATARFLLGAEKQRAIDDIIMARHEQTRHFEYNRTMVDKTAVIQLAVAEMTCKVNPIAGGADI